MIDKVTVIIPAYNEEKNIRKVIINAKRNKNVSEIIVVDNNSTDNTYNEAKLEDVIVLECLEQGKGHAMQKGLDISTNNILVFLDADIANYKKDLVAKLVDPILNRDVHFVKSVFNRDGGRVTELVVRPLIKVLKPDIYHYRQPLSGMIACKKDIFNDIILEKHYGVDIGILIDVHDKGCKIEQVDIGKIENDSRDWHNMIPMAEQIIETILKKVKKI